MIRILVAEDDPVSRRALEINLHKWGYGVELATDGFAAWEVLKRDPIPRIVLLDWMMPGMDGLEVCRRFRQLPHASLSYVILLTAKSSKQEIALGLESGADDYVVKPFDAGELRARIHVGERFVELQQKQAEHLLKLEESEDRYRDLVENSHIWMCTHDLDGTVLSANQSVVAPLGLDSPQGIVGKRLQEFLHPDHRDSFPQYITTILQSGRASGNMRLLARDGTVRILEYQNSLRTDDKGRRIVRGIAVDVTARTLAQKALQDSEARYRQLFDGNPYPMWVYDLATLQFLAVNQAAVRQYGYTAQEFLNLTLRDILPPAEIPESAEDLPQQSPEQATSGVWKHQTKEGKIIEVEITSHQTSFDGRPARLMLSHNISDRKALQQQLQQAQKMEAVGRLAGGVAHDFNNMLGVILAYAEIMLERPHLDDLTRSQTQEIRKAGHRAASLTRQLLAFSRKQVLENRVFTLNQVVRDMEKMLLRLIGEDVELLTKLDESLANVKADPAQIEQVIMNLVVNAHDAMPRGGRLTMETANFEFDERYTSQHVGSVPGSYVMLAVSDSGVGMDKETLSHVFEPFFTTKGRDKGTGLGLSMVYGIVKQSGGYIWVESEPGKGSRFQVFLPRTGAAGSELNESKPAEEKLGGSETILLVEDDDPLRKLTAEFLRDRGYSVLEARDGQEAFQKSCDLQTPIDLLVTDVVMPVLNGFELAGKLASARPHLPVLYMSGYTDDTITRHGGLPLGTSFLQKPVLPRDLAARIRQLLQRDPGHATATHPLEPRPVAH